MNTVGNAMLKIPDRVADAIASTTVDQQAPYEVRATLLRISEGAKE